MIQTGTVIAVQTEALGSFLAADAPAGVTVLAVVDAVDFTEGGGELAVGEALTLLTYTTVNDEARTITLASPLPVALTTDDRIHVWDATTGAPASETLALVEADGSSGAGDALEVVVSHALIPLLPVGIREPGAGEVVTFDRVGTDLVTLDVRSREPAITGTTIQTDLEPGVGIKFDTEGIRAFGNAGLATFEVDAATGNVSLTGTLKAGSSIVGATIVGSEFRTSDDVSVGRVRLSSAGVIVMAAGQTGASGTEDYSIYLANNGSARFRRSVYIDGSLQINGGSASYIYNGGTLTSLAQDFNDEGTYSRMAAGTIEAGRWAPTGGGMGRWWPRTLLRPYGLEFQGPSGAAAGFLSADTDYMRLRSYTDILLTPGTDGNVVVGTGGGFLAVQNMPTTSNAPTVHASPSGLFYRSTSSGRYKQDIEPLALDEVDILAAEPVTFRDRAEVQRHADLDGALVAAEPRRHLGVIAEQLAEAGLDHFIQYDAQGRPDTVFYDRLAVALIPVIRDLRDRTVALEAALAASRSDSEGTTP